MHYIFDSTGSCVITSQTPIEPIEGYTSVESTKVYNPWEIQLVDGAIVKQEPKEETTEEHPHEEQGDTPLPPSVEDLSKSVAGLYELLASVTPPSEEESEGKHE